MNDLEKPQPCTELERAMLGVDKKYVHAGGGPVPAPPGSLRVSRDSLRCLEHLTPDPARQRQARIGLLARSGFDATQTYFVTEYPEVAIYLFRNQEHPPTP